MAYKVAKRKSAPKSLGARKRTYRRGRRYKHKRTHRRRWHRKGQPLKSKDRFSKQVFSQLHLIGVETDETLAHTTYQFRQMQTNVNDDAPPHPDRIVHFGQSTRFQHELTQWEKYAITGMSIRYVPNMTSSCFQWERTETNNRYNTCNMRPVLIWPTTEPEDTIMGTGST